MIMLLIMGAMYKLIAFGVFYVRESNARLEVQQNLLHALHRLSSEIRETNVQTVRTDTNSVLFADPRDNNEFFRFDDKSRIYWHRFLCFSIEPSADTTALVRKNLPLSAPQITPPIPEEFPGATIASMRTDTALETKTLGRGIETMEITVGTDTIDIKLIAKVDLRKSADPTDDFIAEAQDRIKPSH